MELVSRKEAINRGERKYFTGKPCARGHVSERLVCSYNCIACRDEMPRAAHRPEKQKKYREANKEHLKSKYLTARYGAGWKLWKRPRIVMEHKYCTSCHTYKHIDDYYKPGGYPCKSCVNKKSAERWKNNPEFRSAQKSRSRKYALKTLYGLTPRNMKRCQPSKTGCVLSATNLNRTGRC